MAFWKTKDAVVEQPIAKNEYNPNILKIKFEDFSFLYKKMLLENYATKIASRVKNNEKDDTMFKFGLLSDEPNNIVSKFSNFKEIVLNTLASPKPYFVAKIKLKIPLSDGNFTDLFFYDNVSKAVIEDGKGKADNIYKDAEFVNGYTFKQIFYNHELLNLPINLIYNSYTQLFNSLKNNNFTVFKKAGLNAVFQNGNPATFDKTKDEAKEQFSLLMAGAGVVIDKEDEYGYLTFDIKNIKEQTEFAYQQLAQFLGIPVKELTGEQYTNQLGASGAENIDSEKSSLAYQYVLNQFLDMLNALEVKFSVELFTAEERLETAERMIAMKKFETNPEIIAMFDKKIIKLLDTKEFASGV